MDSKLDHGYSEKDVVFPQKNVENIVKSSVSRILKDEMQYDFQESGQWMNEIAEIVMEKLSQLNLPFKYIVTCLIMQNNGAIVKQLDALKVDMMFKSLSRSGNDVHGSKTRKMAVYEEYFSMKINDEWEDRYIMLSNGFLYYFEEDDSVYPLNKDNPITIKNSEFNFITDEDPPHIKITPKEGIAHDPIILSLDEQEEMLPILQHLESLGGTRSSGKKVTGPRITMLNVREWRTADILDWLRFIQRLYNVEFVRLYEQHFSKMKRGEELLKDTSDFSVLEKQHKNYVDEEILDLRRNGKVNLDEYIISLKLHKLRDDYGDNYRNLVKILCGPNKFYRMYFNTNRLKSRKASQYYVRKPLENREFSLRFFFTDSSFMASVLKKKRLRNPTVHEVPEADQKGIGSCRIRLGALVGPFYLEWSDCGIVVPILLDHHNTWIYADTKPCFEVRNMGFEDMAKKLSLFCSRWNSKMTNSKKPTDVRVSVTENEKVMEMRILEYRSSYEFVQSLYAEFKFRVTESPNFCKEYLGTIHKMGFAPMVFSPNLKFRGKFGLITDQYAFDEREPGRGHDKLDVFVKNKLLKKDDMSFNRVFTGERKVLKSFDRILWMRWMRNPAREKRFEKSKSFKACVFGNPKNGVNYPKNYGKNCDWKF